MLGALDLAVREAGAMPLARRDVTWYHERWNIQRISRIEYVLSRLTRLLEKADLLPRRIEQLPTYFAAHLEWMQKQAHDLDRRAQKQLETLNRGFQDVIARDYPGWIAAQPGDPVPFPLTSQFVRRRLRGHWDHQTERAIVLVFDGMRYDVWRDRLWPLLQECMEVISDEPGLALLPSETRLSRWPLAAGLDRWGITDTPLKSENTYLTAMLRRVFGLTTTVGQDTTRETGETIRYHAPRFNYIIFDFCDKGLHHISQRQAPNGAYVPDKPLAWIYDQQFADILNTEVMSVVRGLDAGTKVFITADHGFGPVAADPLDISLADLGAADDCKYLNCWTTTPPSQARVTRRDARRREVEARDAVVAFTPDQLHMPRANPATGTRAGADVSTCCPVDACGLLLRGPAQPPPARLRGRAPGGSSL